MTKNKKAFIKTALDLLTFADKTVDNAVAKYHDCFDDEYVSREVMFADRYTACKAILYHGLGLQRVCNHLINAYHAYNEAMEYAYSTEGNDERYHLTLLHRARTFRLYAVYALRMALKEKSLTKITLFNIDCTYGTNNLDRGNFITDTDKAGVGTPTAV